MGHAIIWMSGVELKATSVRAEKDTKWRKDDRKDVFDCSMDELVSGKVSLRSLWSYAL